jgi:endonuclease/exonuclease/phosphatase family metal-dependent hydrolase
MSPVFKKIIRLSFISANIVVFIFYLLACLVPFINSGRSWFIAMLGLVFPLLFFVMLGFLIYWLIRKSNWAFICIVTLLLSWKQVYVMFSFHLPEKFKVYKAPETLRILTWNLSSWGESSRSIKMNNISVMVDLLKNTDADVLCLQEFLYFKDKRYQDSVFTVLKESGYQYGYFAKPNYTQRIYKTTRLITVAILSKYPIADTAQFFYSEDDFSESLIYADIKINNQPIRVFTTHLQSVRFENNDFEALHKLKEPYKASARQSRAMAGKLKYAYISRAAQAEMFNKKIKESPYPVIVCGDFNDVPNSYTYFTIKENLQDAFLKKGNGFGRTFRFISPTLRIDYILAGKKFDVIQFGKIEVPYSDHYPIIADFNIPKN